MPAVALCFHLLLGTARAQPASCDVFTNRYACRLFGSEPPVVYGSTVGATQEAQCEALLPHARDWGGRSSVWYVWQPPMPGYALVQTLDSDFDTLLGVYVGKDVCDFDHVAHNDDEAVNQPTSRVEFDADSDLDYQIVVDGKQAASGDFGLRIKLYTCPEILVQPVSQPTAERKPVEFSVTALGARPLSHRWQHRPANSPAEFRDLAGETRPSLRFVASTNHAGEYRVVITNSYCTVTSLVAVLDVQSTPEITLAPQPGTNTACGRQCFTVSAVGGLPLTNRWQFRPRADSGWQELEVDVSSTGTSTFCLDPLSTDHTGEYRVLVANAAGSAHSEAVRLEVTPWPPEITRHPTDQLGFEGESVSLEVGHRGPGCEPTTFHWLYRETNAPPVTPGPFFVTDGPQLTLPWLDAGYAGYYSVIVSNRYGASPPSKEARLTVVRRPPNDDLVNRILIPEAPATVSGWNNYGSTESGEPDHNGKGAQHSVWWSYQPPRLGVVAVDLTGSRLTPRLGVYTGPGFGALTKVTSGGPGVVFLAQPDQEYLIAVDGVNGSEGAITLRLDFSDGSCPEWRSEPSSFEEIGDVGGGTGCRTRWLSGEAVSLTPLSYQWLWENQPIPNATNPSLRLENLTTDRAGEYRLVARNNACAITSQVARVSVRVEPRLLREPAVPVKPLPLCTNRLRLEVEAESCAQPVTYQWRHFGEPLPDATNAFLVIPSLDPRTAGGYDVVVANRNGAVVSRVVVCEADPVPPLTVTPARTEHTLCSDVVLRLATDECFDVAYQWRQNGAPLPQADQPMLVLNNLSPAQVGDYDAVLTFGGTTLTSRLAQVRLLAPGIRKEPDLPVYDMCSTTRLVLDSADCEGTARYQWRLDQQPLPGATNPFLLLDQLTPANAGHYDVVLAFGALTLTSRVVEVTVTGAPVITRQPQAVTVTNCAAASLCVEVRSSPCVTPRFQWFVGSSPASATRAIAGATSPCLAFDSVSREDAGTYVVEVRTDFATNRSSAALLVVNTAPRITLQPSPGFERLRAGQSFTNAIRAESCPPRLDYHWMLNGQPVDLDANHLIQGDGWLVVRNAGPDDSGAYHCVVDNGLATTASSTRTIRVVVPPLNDNFANRIALTGMDITATTFADGSRYHNEMATDEPGETGHGGAGQPPALSVWWTWTAPTPGRVTLDLSGSTSLSGGAFDTLLGVYRGERVGALSLVTHDDNSATDGLASRVSFLAAKGRTFQIAVDGKNRAEGHPRLRLVEEEIISPPIITQHPYSLAATNGETATFSVEAHGSPDLLYQWSKDGIPLVGATNAWLVLTNVQRSDQGNYRVHIRNDYPPETNSHIARLTFGTIIRGQVTDATNDKPIPGARVSVDPVSTLTDENGNYELVGVEPGELRADFDAESKRGEKVVVGLLDEVQFVDRSTLNAVTLRCQKRPEFIDFEDTQFEPPRGRSVTNEISMSPVLTGMRFVLNWGREPADLDLVLLAEHDPGYWQVDYLWVGQGGSNTPPYVTFDVDARKSFGPETVTLHRVVTGNYWVYVRKFVENARGSLPTSGAAVRVYEHDPDADTNRLVGVREVPKEGDGNYWFVCQVDGANRVVRWPNTLVSRPPGPARSLASLASAPLSPGSAPFSGPGPSSHEPPQERGLQSAGSYAITGTSLEAGARAPRRLMAGEQVPEEPRALQGPSLSGIRYRWDLGDGVTYTNDNHPLHAYTTPGCKDIRLELTQPRGTATFTSVTNKPCFVVVTNAPPVVAIIDPPPQRLFRARDPIPITITAADTDRQPAARVVARVELFRIEAGRTNLLATLLAAPYTWTCTNTDAEGPYRFVARAVDNHGAATWSAPVSVDVMELSGDILIIRNGTHTELDVLQRLLAVPSVPKTPGDMITELAIPVVRVVDQARLHFDLVRDFRLIIWNDGALAGAGVQPHTVEVLLEAWRHGIPLYFIGRHLASDGLRLSSLGAQEAARVWRELVRLEPAAGTVAGCAPAIEPPGSIVNELFESTWHGPVEMFPIAEPVEPAVALTNTHRFVGCDPSEPRSPCLDDAQVRLGCGPFPLLVRTPRLGQDSAMRPLRLSQTFLVNDGDATFQSQRDTLFLNSVLWLLRLGCQQHGPTLDFGDGLPEHLAQACETFTTRVRLTYGAECIEGGVLVTASVPEALELCGASVVDAGPDSHPVAIFREGARVLFDFGLLRNGERYLEFTLRACQPGLFTIRFELTSPNRQPQVLEQAIRIEGPACADCAPPRLSATLAAGFLELRVHPPPGCPARVETSADLRVWEPVPDGSTPWRWRLPMSLSSQRFYRLNLAP